MLIVSLLSAAFLICLLVSLFDPYGDWSDLCGFGSIIFGMALAFCAITVGLNRMQWSARFHQVEAVRAARAGGEAIEGAAWRLKVAEVNAILAGGRYYNGTMFDIWIPDEVLSVKPIE